jgi:hypothetical protein
MRMKRPWFPTLAAVAALAAACGSTRTAQDAVTEDTGSGDIEAAGDLAPTDPGSADAGIFDSGHGTDEGVDPGAPPPWWQDLAGSGPTLREMFGVSSHMYQGPGDNAKRDFEFQIYQEAGGARVREDFHWHKIEPADDAFTFEPVATQVAMAQAAGARLLPMLAYGVDWAMTEGTTDSIDPDEYGAFAGRLAREFCDEVKDYELWNEQNITRFWTKAPNPEHYGRFVKAAAAAIRDECPDARIVFGGLASYDDVEMFNRWGFLRRAFEAHPDLCRSFDVLAIHPYTWFQYDPPEHDNRSPDAPMESQTAMTTIARQILDAGGCGDVPIWFTEVGWPSYELSEEQVGRFAARSFLLAAQDGVEAYYWYTFWDSRPTTEGLRPHEAYFGLFGWAGEDGTARREKPAWTALKTILARMGDARFARDPAVALGLPDDVHAPAFVDDAGTITLALWDGREKPDETPQGAGEGGPETRFDLVLPLPPGFAVSGAWDIVGNATAIPEGVSEASITLTTSPIYLRIGPSTAD